jgi:predicted metal-dependent HD superfamily phosphohydrolase
MLRNEYFNSLTKYCHDVAQQQTLWDEIEIEYSSPLRYYHTLTHLDAVTTTLLPFKDRFENWDAVVFAIAYHDFIYSAHRTNNELRSAGFATKRLRSIGFPQRSEMTCRHMILATKDHAAADESTNLFTDADLSILGAEPMTYREYATRIKWEHWLVYNYNMRRIKVLETFLAMKTIFKTPEFIARYEQQARVNLQWEISQLASGGLPDPPPPPPDTRRYKQ